MLRTARANSQGKSDSKLTPCCSCNSCKTRGPGRNESLLFDRIDVCLETTDVLKTCEAYAYESLSVSPIENRLVVLSMI